MIPSHSRKILVKSKDKFFIYFILHWQFRSRISTRAYFPINYHQNNTNPISAYLIHLTLELRKFNRNTWFCNAGTPSTDVLTALCLIFIGFLCCKILRYGFLFRYWRKYVVDRKDVGMESRRAEARAHTGLSCVSSWKTRILLNVR